MGDVSDTSPKRVSRPPARPKVAFADGDSAPNVAFSGSVTTKSLKGMVQKAVEEDDYMAGDHAAFTALLDGLYKGLKSSASTGISSNAAQIESRQQQYGVNIMPPPPPATIWELLLEALKDETLIILIVAALVNIVVGVVMILLHDENSHEEEEPAWVEGVAILGTVAVVVFVTAYLEYSKELQFQKLNAVTEAKQLQVLRDGQDRTIDSANLVVGDVVIVNYGDSVPADGFFIGGSDCKIDEAAMTGESDLLLKKCSHPKESYMLAGTNCMAGRALMLVLAVGWNSRRGEIKRSLLDDQADDGGEDDESVKKGGLDYKLNSMAKLIFKIGLVAALVATLVLYARWGIDAYTDNWVHKDWASTISKKIVSPLIIGVTVLVVAVPEGLPLAVTIALAYSVMKMLRDNNLVRHLEKCEVMGACTTICSDKTGTLTTNRMTVVKANIGLTEYDVANLEQEKLEQLSGIVPLMQNLTMNTGWEAKLVTRLKPAAGKNDKPLSLQEDSGNKTDCACIKFARTLGAEFNTSGDRADSDGEVAVPKLRVLSGGGRALRIPFNSTTKCAAMLIPISPGGDLQDEEPAAPNLMARTLSARKLDSTAVHDQRVLVKGAAEVVVGWCTRRVGWDANGELTTLEFTPEEQAKMQAQITSYGSQTYRNIGVAYRDLDAATSLGDDLSADAELTEQQQEGIFRSNLTLLGVLCIKDPLRAEVTPAIRQCEAGQIQVRMVTGDNVNTARAIAQECGIFDPQRVYIRPDGSEDPVRGDTALLGKELREAVLQGAADENTSDDQLKIDMDKFDRIWPRLTVVARCQPLDKRLLVKGLMNSKRNVVRPQFRDLRGGPIHRTSIGERVAVTGDGTNDAPALSKADVGFAMGIQGTDVAKDAAAIVILDDNFASIVKAAMWGRNVYDSVQKFLQFQLTVNLVAIVLAVLGAVIIGVSPLTAVQLLWVNMIMDAFASLALATEEPKPSIMDRAPFPKNATIISRIMWRNIFGHAIYQVVVLAVFVFYGAGTPTEKGGIFDLYSGIPPSDQDDALCYAAAENGTYARSKQECRAHFSMVFNMFVFMQLFNQINARKIFNEFNIFDGICSNPLFVLITLGEMGFQVVIGQFGGSVFHVEGGLTLEQWLICVAFGVSSLPVHIIVSLVPAACVPDFILNFENVGEGAPEELPDTATKAKPPKGTSTAKARWRMLYATSQFIKLNQKYSQTQGERGKIERLISDESRSSVKKSSVVTVTRAKP